ncbi:hypothetical protein PHISP_07715 [Aspergillus sp. HF37]|nr:hypothetical protein PHISP_07715 [Aspergillus sp. HF37]
MPPLRKMFSKLNLSKDEKENQKPEVKPGKQQHQKIPSKSIKGLQVVYRGIYESNSVYIDDNLLAGLRVDCRELTLHTDGTPMPYFRPWRQEDLDAHPVNIKDEFIESLYDSLDGVITDIDEEKRKDPTDGAVLLGQLLDNHFTTFVREGPMGRKSLDLLSNWHDGLVRRDICQEA